MARETSAKHWLQYWSCVSVFTVQQSKQITTWAHGKVTTFDSFSLHDRQRFKVSNRCLFFGGWLVDGSSSSLSLPSSSEGTLFRRLDVWFSLLFLKVAMCSKKSSTEISPASSNWLAFRMRMPFFSLQRSVMQYSSVWCCESIQISLWNARSWRNLNFQECLDQWHHFSPRPHKPFGPPMQRRKWIWALPRILIENEENKNFHNLVLIFKWCQYKKETISNGYLKYLLNPLFFKICNKW